MNPWLLTYLIGATATLLISLYVTASDWRVQAGIATIQVGDAIKKALMWPVVLGSILVVGLVAVIGRRK